MAPEQKIITLYDVPSHMPGKAWSPNMWKARFALNFKGVPYRTEWIEYPDIEPTMRRIGAAPTGTKADGSPFYTLPVIVDPSRRTAAGGPTVISESFLIAEYLDEAYPTSNQLFPEGTKALQKFFYDSFFPSVLAPTISILFPEVYGKLNEESRPYWRQTRELWVGKKLEELCPKESEKWDEAWASIQKVLANIATSLDKNGKDANIRVTGKNLVFSDLVIAAFLECLFLISPEDWEAKVHTWDGGRWVKFRDQCANWRKVD